MILFCDINWGLISKWLISNAMDILTQIRIFLDGGDQNLCILFLYRTLKTILLDTWHYVSPTSPNWYVCAVSIIWVIMLLVVLVVKLIVCVCTVTTPQVRYTHVNFRHNHVYVELIE